MSLWDINAYSSGWTPLFAAVKYKHLSTVQLLLKHKVNVDAWISNSECDGTSLLYPIYLFYFYFLVAKNLSFFDFFTCGQLTMEILK